MFKQRKNKYKNLVKMSEEQIKGVSSNFKSGSIELTTHEVLKIKLRNLNELCGLPKTNQQFRIVTQKSINSFDFILAVLADENIEEMIIAFYRIGKKVVNELNSLVLNKKIHFLINDGAPKLIPEPYNLIKSLEKKNWKIRLANNHTKIILLKTKGNYYVIEGSGNLSINARIEQYVFDNNKSLFDFHKNWIIQL